MTADTKDRNPPPPTPARLPILMSAVVYPGVGQYMQRRWMAALVYAVSFTVFIALSLWLAFREFLVLLRSFEHAIETGAAYKMHAPVMKPILKSGGLAVLIYLANVYDTWLAYHRQAIARRNAGT